MSPGLRSSRSRSGVWLASRASPSAPVAACSAWKPARRRYFLMRGTSPALASTTRTVRAQPFMPLLAPCREVARLGGRRYPNMAHEAAACAKRIGFNGCVEIPCLHRRGHTRHDLERSAQSTAHLPLDFFERLE